MQRYMTVMDKDRHHLDTGWNAPSGDLGTSGRVRKQWLIYNVLSVSTCVNAKSANPSDSIVTFPHLHPR